MRWEKHRRDKASPWTHVLVGHQLTIEQYKGMYRVLRDGRVVADLRTLSLAKAFCEDEARPFAAWPVVRCLSWQPDLTGWYAVVHAGRTVAYFETEAHAFEFQRHMATQSS